MLKVNAAPMKNLQAPFGNLKSVAILVVVAGIVLISGFVATQILLFTGKSKENSVGANVNVSSIALGGELNSNNPGASPSKPPANANRPRVTSGNPNVTVWVNTSTGVYHCPNTRWYGNTKSGTYMTQQEAQSKGYRPAYGSICG